MRRLSLFVLLVLISSSTIACGRDRERSAASSSVAAAVQAAEVVAGDSKELTDSDSLIPADDARAATIEALLDNQAPQSTPSGAITHPIPPIKSVRPTVAPTPTADRPILLPTPTPDPSDVESATPTAIIDKAYAIVNADLINVRTGPSTQYGVAGQLQNSSELELSGRNEDGSWLQVCCPFEDDEQNWVSAELVDVQMPTGQDINTLTIADAPPPPEPIAVSAAVPAAVTGAGEGLPPPGSFPAPGGTNPLTGQPLPGDRSGQQPVIVCINNDFAARPQMGTSQADIVYEYLMEGYGITRFSAIYYGGDEGQIGPVRSARLINYYMGALYEAGLACSGASDGVRYLLKHQAPFPYMDVDLDDPSNTRYSVSIGSDYRTRLRTSTAKLRQWLVDWGVQKPASIRGFTFGDAPGDGASGVSVSIPYPNGQASFQYDAGSGRYLRNMSGAAHTDGNTGAQLAVENVIVQVVPHQATDIVEDSLGSTSIRLNLFGSGDAIVFRDGRAFEATWRSESRGDTPRFYDAGGAEIALKPGHTWISVVPPGYGYTFQ